MSDRWVKAATLADIPEEGFGLAASADGLDIALFRSGDDIFALENLCPHLGFPLSEGIVQAGEVICSWHGWHVRLSDGQCPRETERARVYPCEVRGPDVYVKIS